ncbi:MAG: glutaminyl-peptide cyclotransferase [Pseudomonadota bacterium]
MFRSILLAIALTLISPWGFAVEHFGYQVVDKKPQSRDIKVQGLEILNDKLYVSSGGYNTSRLLRFNFTTGELEEERAVAPEYFAEGLTIFDDRLLLLTWKSGVVFVYNKATLQGIKRLEIPTQGWGITHSSEELIYSDGTDRLYFLSPDNYQYIRAVRVTLNGAPLQRLNELEWINGKVWANVWQTDQIVIIDPDNGVVEGVINLQGLLPIPERISGTDVLNGIALNPADGGIWVTGKHWPWMYRIELVPVAGADGKTL